MTLRRVLVIALMGLVACVAPRGETGRASRAVSDAPGVRLVEPAGCTVLTTEGPPVDLEVRFEVWQVAYPATSRGVAFLLDGSDQPFAVAQTSNVVVLDGLAPGRHRVAACLVTKDGDGAWHAAEACTCDVITVDVVLAGCSLLVTNPITGEPACNPAAPAGSCCLDANPCSVETCDASAGTPVCAFAATAPDCCLSDLDCGAGQFCHRVDDPTSVADDLLGLNRCASCDQCPAAGATCPAVCGACPSCPDENACGGGLCPLAPPAPEPQDQAAPELPPDVTAPDAANAGDVPAADAPQPDAAPDGTAAEVPGYTVEVAPDPGPEPAAGGGGSCTVATRPPRDSAWWLAGAAGWLTAAAVRRRRRVART